SAGAGCGVDGSGSGVHGCLLGVCGDAVCGPSGDHGGGGLLGVGGAHVALVDVGELGDGCGGGVVVVHGSSVSPCLQSRQARSCTNFLCQQPRPWEGATCTARFRTS